MSQISQSNKLRDLIKNIRACKTAAEERALVQIEKANIRESFLKSDDQFRARNVAKLLFINMLGHDTEFGQMECLKLITTNSFTEKRIGYLGLTQLFHEKSEVLMMATHRIHNDLNSSSNYIISLALIALSEVCTTEMCRELVQDVLKIMHSGTSFVKKKAALAAIKILKKLPETADDLADKVDILMEDRHHGVLLSTLSLVEVLIKHKAEYKNKFKKYFSPMIRVLKGLVSSFSAEFDIAGVSDPFLQIQILKFFRLMAQDNQQLSDEVSDILAQIATNTSSAKNTGNSVLYECVQTIFAIQSANTLKTLAINILGKFLVQKDNNSKYLSLYMLKQVINYDMNSVQKHKQIIMDCLKEKDKSIKQMALDLTYLITNQSNVRQIVKEQLNYLLTQNDPDFMEELTSKICATVNKHSPNRVWHIDTVIKVLTLAGNYIKEESIFSLIHLICSTPQLQNYAVHKLYFYLNENQNQDGLAKAGLYIIGEFGQLLSNRAVAQQDLTIRVSESEVIELIKKIFERQNVHYSIKEYGLTCLIKLYTKYKSQRNNIVALIQSQERSTYQEVQKRSCEYLSLIKSSWDGDREAICDTIPCFAISQENFKDIPVGEVDQEEFPVQEQKNNTFKPLGDISTSQSKQQVVQNQNNNDLFDLDDIIGAPSTQQTSVQSVNISDIDTLGDVFGDKTQKVSQSQPIIQQTKPVQQTSNDLTDLLSHDLDFTPQQQQVHKFTAYQDQQLDIIFHCVQEKDTTNIKAYFNNKTQFEIDNIVLQVAVVKYLKLTLTPLVSQKIPAYSNNTIFQALSIQNSQHGQKSVMVKLKVLYTYQNQQISNECTVGKESFQFIVDQQTNQQVNIQQQPIQQIPSQSQQNFFSPSQNQATFSAFQDQNIEFVFQCTNEADMTSVNVLCSNKTGNIINGVNLQIAVQKHMKITMNPVLSDTLQPFSKGQQLFVSKIQNTTFGVVGANKPIVVKIRVLYTLNGQQIVQQATVQDFPKNW